MFLPRRARATHSVLEGEMPLTQSDAIEVKRVRGKGRGVFARRSIEAGEEITVNYNGEPGDETPVGFEVVEGPNSSAMNGSSDLG